MVILAEGSGTQSSLSGGTTKTTTRRLALLIPTHKTNLTTRSRLANCLTIFKTPQDQLWPPLPPGCNPNVCKTRIIYLFLRFGSPCASFQMEFIMWLVYGFCIHLNFGDLFYWSWLCGHRLSSTTRWSFNAQNRFSVGLEIDALVKSPANWLSPTPYGRNHSVVFSLPKVIQFEPRKELFPPPNHSPIVHDGKLNDI